MVRMHWSRQLSDCYYYYSYTHHPSPAICPKLFFRVLWTWLRFNSHGFVNNSLPVYTYFYQFRFIIAFIQKHRQTNKPTHTHMCFFFLSNLVEICSIYALSQTLRATTYIRCAVRINRVNYKCVSLAQTHVPLKSAQTINNAFHSTENAV